MKQKLKASFAAANKSADRELGIFMVMVIFGIASAVVAIPMIFILSLLPDWGWIVFFACALAWFVLGDTIKAAVSACKEAHNDEP